MSFKAFVRNSVLLVSAELMAKFFGVVFFVLIARSLGAGDLGRYSFAVALANFFVIAPRFGFEELVQREVSRDLNKGRRFFKEISALKVVLSAASLGLLGIFCSPKADFIPVMLAACFVFSYSFMEFVDSFFRAIQKSELELVVRGLFSVGNLALGVLVIYLGWGLMGVMSSQLAAVMIALISAAMILNRVLPHADFEWRWSDLKGYIVSAAPFAGILVALYLSNQVCTLTLSYFTDKTKVGYYAAAMRVMDCLVLIPAAIMGSFLPTMSKFYPRSVTSFVQTLRLTFKYLFIISAPLLVILVIMARPIILCLYREGFSPAADALRIMGLVLPFSFWNYLATTSLIARNREKSAMASLWVIAAVHIAANLLFIPKFAHVGACWAIFVTQASFFAILFYSSRRFISIAHLFKSILSPLAGAAVMALFLYMAEDRNIFLTIPAGIAVYIGFLLLSGAISRTEIHYFRSWRFT